MMPLTEGGMAPRNIACTIKTMGVSGSNQSAPQEGLNGQQAVTQHLISEPVAEPGVRQQQGIGAAAAAGEQWSGCR